MMKKSFFPASAESCRCRRENPAAVPDLKTPLIYFTQGRIASFPEIKMRLQKQQ